MNLAQTFMTLKSEDSSESLKFLIRILGLNFDFFGLNLGFLAYI